MKSKTFTTLLTLFFIILIYLPIANAEDYTQIGLPEGAKARLGKGIIYDIQLSHDGTKLAIASSIGVWLYDVNTRRETALISAHTDTVTHVAFSPDSKTLASSAIDKTVRLWNTETGSSLQTLDIPKDTLFSLNFSKDGQSLIGLTQQKDLLLWDSTTGKLQKTYRPKYRKIKVLGKVWLPAMAAFVDRVGVVTFAIANKDGTITIQNGQTGKNMIVSTRRTDDSQFIQLSGKPTVHAVLPAPIDEREHHTTYRDDGKPFPIQFPIGSFSHSKSYLDQQPVIWKEKLEFSPDGKTLVSSSQYLTSRNRGMAYTQGPIEIWDVDTGEQLAALRSNRVKQVAFSGDGKCLALTGYAGCVIWDIGTRSKIATFLEVETVRFSGDGKLLYLISKDNYTVWDLFAGQEISKVPLDLDESKPFPERFVLSGDGATLATTDANGEVHVWQSHTDEPLITLTSSFTRPFTSLTVSHDGKTIATSDVLERIQLWDVSTRRKRMTIKTDEESIRALTFTKDNQTLISESRGDIKMWNINSGELQKAYTIPEALVGSFSDSFNDGTHFSGETVGIFAQNGNKLIIQTRSGTEIWDTINGKELYTFTNIDQHWYTSTINEETFVYGIGSKVFLWDLKKGEEVGTLKTSKGFFDGFLERFNFRNFNVHALAFTPDGKTLVVGNGDKKIQLWDIVDQRLIDTMTGHQHAVCQLAFSADGKILASGDTGGKIHLWEFATRRHLATYQATKRFVHTLAFAPDGKTLVSMNARGYKQDGTIYLWHVPSK
ncbi:PQQ-binding-like beta-propeller repeat protein [Candidatus Poribacteria bacterium]|nr:PQQ-binding-like beta-propeller repeat protein [Candidatus Poribacteria bacterium]MYB63985.1 PQQ-binding-like beta-propeller repeat protein [Candidatus Poribacteria bacterium]